MTHRVLCTIAVVCAALVAASAQQRPDGTQIVSAAASGLGGKDLVLAVKTLRIEGEGVSLGGVVGGGAPSPKAPPNVTKITDYRQSIDVERERMRVTSTRTLQFPFALNTLSRPDQRLDGDVAFGIGGPFGAGGSGRGGPALPARAGNAAWRQRRLEFLSHPITIVRAAFHPGATLSKPRTEGGRRLVDVTTAYGETVTLAVDAKTSLPTSVSWRAADDFLGDITQEILFAEYEEVAGVKVPRKISARTDHQLSDDLTISKNTINGDVGDLVAPDAVRKSSPPVPPAPTMVVTAEPVAKGVWYMGGTGEHSVLLEFADHLVLFETPGNDARTLAVISKARETVPGKPLTTAINSHHHSDHAGGFRAAVSEGLTMVMYKDVVPYFKDLATRPRTMNPDALSKAPKPLKVRSVDDSLTLKDATMEVVLYHIKGDPHADTELVAWIPRDRILVEADQYDRTWLQHPWGDNFIKNVDERKLAVDRILAVHGMGPEPWSEVVETIRAKAQRPQP